MLEDACLRCSLSCDAEEEEEEEEEVEEGGGGGGEMRFGNFGFG